MYQPFLEKDVDLDDWVREVIQYQFDEKHGSPYWLEKEDDLGIDAKKDIRSYEDFRILGEFEEEVLRNISVEEFAPKSLTNSEKDKIPIDSSGSGGAPKRVLEADYFDKMSEWSAHCLDEEGVPRDINILMVGPPGGANRIGSYVDKLANIREGLAFHINMDPRWVKKLKKNGKMDEMKAYMDHIGEQSLNILETQDIDMIFTSSKVLETPEVRSAIDKYDISVIYHGGTALDPETHKVFRTEWYKDRHFTGGYGNTLMGVAQQAWPELYDKEGSAEEVLESTDFSVDYIPCFPFFKVDIVDPENPEEKVDYGEKGRVKITTLSKEFFVPNSLERDEAVRKEGEEPYEWDWVRNPGIFSEMKDESVEGVY